MENNSIAKKKYPGLQYGWSWYGVLADIYKVYNIFMFTILLFRIFWIPTLCEFYVDQLPS